MAAESLNLRNQFLLAMPNHFGGYFANAIIYMCDHNAEGGMGLVVNRPLELKLSKLLTQMNIEPLNPLRDDSVLEGGPMDSQKGFILHTADADISSSAFIDENLQLSTAREALAAIAIGQGPSRYLVATGYAGWGPGQLEHEMAENAWLSCPSDPDILFDEPFSTRVTKAADNIGINFHLMSTQAGYD